MGATHSTKTGVHAASVALAIAALCIAGDASAEQGAMPTLLGTYTGAGATGALGELEARTPGERAHAHAQALRVDGAGAFAALGGEDPNRIGVHVVVERDLTENGHAWREEDDGSQRAGARVESPGAQSLRAKVRFTLPEDATLSVFDAQARHWGSVRGEGQEATKWLPSVDGERLYLELKLHSEYDVDGARAVLTRVAHGNGEGGVQDDTFNSLGTPPASGAQGSLTRTAKAGTRLDTDVPCHVNVACATTPHAPSVRDAVAKIRFERGQSTFQCTAALLNSDTRAPGDVLGRPEPYLLTANHCVASEESAESLEARWFHRATTCRGNDIEPRDTRTRTGATLVATRSNGDWSLLKLKEAPPAGVAYAGWTAVPRLQDIGPDNVFTIHHTNGRSAQIMEGTGSHDLLYASSNAAPRPGIRVSKRLGGIDNGASGSPIFGNERLIAVVIGGAQAGRGCDSAFGSSMEAIYPHIAKYLSPPRKRRHVIATLPGHTTGGAQGVVQVHNNEDEAIALDVLAYDDAGERYEGTTLRIGAGRATTFTTQHLEDGHPRRTGALPGVGDGEGFWRLDVLTAHDIELLGYFAAPGGFATALHDTVPNSAGRGEPPVYRIKFFNPGTNRAARSLLRLVNPRAEALTVTVEAIDALAQPAQESVIVEVPARGAVNLSSQALEAGDPDDFTGRFGDGAGKWRLTVRAPKTLHVASLLFAASGHIANVSR